ncbi:TPA: hypothetical protein SML58_000865 [Serratia marcescens]|nr:hypothetical protein [Serratia marcescens]
MTSIQRFTPDYKMHAVRFEPFAREAEHGEYVRFDAHQQTVSALEAERDALAVENAALKLSRETLAKNALETCNDVFSAGYHSPALHRGLMESTGNRNTYPNPISALVNEAVRELETPATDAALAAIQAQAKAEAIEQLAIQLEQLPDDAFDALSDAAEFETYQEEHHTFVSISNPRAVANAVLSLAKEQSTEQLEAK